MGKTIRRNFPTEYIRTRRPRPVNDRWTLDGWYPAAHRTTQPLNRDDYEPVATQDERKEDEDTQNT